MTHGSITDEELAELIRRTEEATSAFMRGDMSRYLALTPHARGDSLMNPFGGGPPITTAAKGTWQGQPTTSPPTSRPAR